MTNLSGSPLSVLDFGIASPDSRPAPQSMEKFYLSGRLLCPVEIVHTRHLQADCVKLWHECA